MSERFVNTLCCRDCGAQVMLDDAFIRANGVCFRCTDIVAKLYKFDHCKDCGVQMRPDTITSELVCLKCGRVEEVGGVPCATTRASKPIKQENVYLKKTSHEVF